MNVTQVFGQGITAQQGITILSKFQKLYLIVFLVFLVWAILTALIMLGIAHKSAKRGQLMKVFVVSSIILLIILLFGYFNMDKLVVWFNV